MAQSEMVARALAAAHPGLAVELVPRVTEGDVLPGDLAARGRKGLFTRALEAGLLDGSLDLAVHSLKDLPAGLPDGLVVAAYPERADPRDVLVSELAEAIAALPAGAVLLTGSLRRRAQLLAQRPDLVVEPVRGNVDTRLRKWREQRVAGVVLAAAGLARLGLEDVPAHPIPTTVMLPAPGQGTLAIEVPRGGIAEALCRALDHPPTARAAAAERGVVAAFGGDCTLPLAAWAREDGGRLLLSALLASPDGRRLARGEGSGAGPDAAAAACIAALREDGADELLAELRR
jgi:hydroxymethylbilane synthase